MKDLSQQRYFFRACPAEKGIIDDQYITAVLVGKRFNFLYNRRTQLKREFTLVDAAGIHEPVKGIFCKWYSSGRLPLFLEESLIAEGIFKGHLEYVFDRKAAYFVGIAGFENPSWNSSRK